MVSRWLSLCSFICHVHPVYIHLSVHPSGFLIGGPNDNLSKYLWIFTKFRMCIDIVKIWFWIANGQISPIFDRVICPPHDSGVVLLFHVCIIGGK